MCTENLIEFNDFCTDNNIPKVENYIEISNKILSNLANEDEITGQKLGQKLIKSATEQVIADLSNANTNVIFNNISENLHFNGNFNAKTFLNGGCIIRKTKASILSKIVIKTAKIKPLFDGAFALNITDGTITQTFNFVAVNGIEMNIDLPFETFNNFVQITNNENKPFAQIDATQKTCSSCSGKSYKMNIQPVQNNQISNIFNTIIPVGYLECSTENYICFIMQNTNLKRQIVFLIANKIGILAYERLLLSTRFNDSTLNINKDATEIYLSKLEATYNEYMFGLNFANGQKKSNVMPLTLQISNFLKGQKDDCITCNAPFIHSTPVF